MKLIHGHCPECGPSAGAEWIITDKHGNTIYATRNYEWAIEYLRKLAAAVHGEKQDSTTRKHTNTQGEQQ